MNSNLTDVTFLIDRSGSMEDIKSQVESTMKEILNAQKTGIGECRLNVYQFDGTGTNFDGLSLEKTIDNVKIEDVKQITISPRGSTPLRDAVCRAIDETGHRFSSMPEHERPSKVVFVIVTDGYENASRVFSWQQVQERVQRQDKVYNWLFMYVGCDQDALAEGSKLGLKAGHSMTYKRNQHGIDSLGKSLTGKLSAVRGMSAEQYSCYNQSNNVFTTEDVEMQENS